MSNVLFVNGNLHGHINPTLPLVRELVTRGENVWYFCGDAFKEKVRSAGARFISSGTVMDEFYRNYQSSGNHPFYSIVEYIVRLDQVLVPVVLEKTKDMQFDYIIHDSILGGGEILGKKMGLPVISSSSSFAMNHLPIPDRMLERGFHPQLDHLYSLLETVYQDWNMPAPGILDVFFKKGELNIVYTSKEFQPDSETFDSSFKFIGPTLRDHDDNLDFPLEWLDSDKILYISLGTINTRFVDFYKTCIEALGESDWNVVMSIGTKSAIEEIGEIPDNFIVRNTVPQLEILKRTSIFISHGGMNSVMESLFYGVPVIAIPMVNDQHLVARQLTASGAGFALRMEDINPVLILESIQRVLNDPTYREACKRISESFHTAGGCAAGVNCIFDWKKTKGLL